MRSLSSIILFVVLPLLLNGQGYFNKYLPAGNGTNPNPTDLLVNNNGELVIQSLHVNNETYLWILDFEGELIESLRFDGFGTAGEGVEEFNGGYVMWGEDKDEAKGLILEFLDNNFMNRITSKIESSGDWDFPARFIIADNEIYTLHVYRDSSTNLLHGIVSGIDQDGQLIWQTDLHDGEGFVNIYRIKLNNKGELIVSSRFDNDSNDPAGVVTVLNKSGSIIRQKVLPEEISSASFNEIVELSNGDIICGTVIDRRQDWDYIQNNWFGLPTKYYWLSGDNLQEQKDTIYTSPNFEEPGGEKLWKGNGDYFFIYGHIWYVDEDQTYGMLKKVDNDGNILWSRRYQHEDFTGDKNFHGLVKIEEMPDGSIYTAGSVRFVGDRNHIWIMHLDENGCLGDGECGEVVITDVKEVSIASEQLTLYPNPVTDILTLKYLDTSKDYTYKVVDLMGKGLLSGEINESVNAKIDVASLKQGLYHIVIQPSQGEVQVIRFVKQ